MTQEELLARLSLALAIGLLIGLERGWRSRAIVEGGRTAGLRTFALIGLSGGLWAMLSAYVGPIPLAAAFLAVAGGITLFRWRQIQRQEDYGATTLVAAYLTFALGAFAAVGDVTVAAAAAVTTTALLAAKSILHRWVAAMTWLELRATLVLLVMSFVALPLLPDVGLGPYGAINPHDLWLMAIAIAGVSYAGYATVKLTDERYGALITGFGGGLVSSTAATVDAARKARPKPGFPSDELSAAYIASAVMFIRIMVIVALFGSDLLPFMAVPAAAAALVMLLAAGVLFMQSTRTADKQDQPKQDQPVLANPLEVGSVLRFAALLAAIMVVSQWLSAMFGGTGANAVAGAAGLADVDAITLTMAELSPSALTLAEGAGAVLIAAAANSLSKTVIALIVGGLRFAVPYAAVTAAALGVAAAAWFLLPIFPAELLGAV